MSHEDYKEMIPARALSALDAAEERVLNEHLDNCSECRKELEEWQATAAALAIVPGPVEPSPKVRERILSEVRKELSTPEVIPFRSTSRNIWRSFGSMGAMAAVVLLTALIVALIVIWRENRLINAQLASAEEFIELVKTPGAQVSELKGVDLGQGATARFVHDRDGHAILVADNMPKAPQGKAYQLWFIVKNENPIPGSVFVPDNEGAVRVKEQLPKAALDASIFAITLEPAGGGKVPTGPIYLRTSEIN